jgi:hypothetical protein
MDDIFSIHAAKTHLSQLLARVEAGEVITIARGKSRSLSWSRRVTQALIRECLLEGGSIDHAGNFPLCRGAQQPGKRAL